MGASSQGHWKDSMSLQFRDRSAAGESEVASGRRDGGEERKSRSLPFVREGKLEATELFVEEKRLGGSGGGGFAAGDAHDAEHGDFGEGCSRDEDAVGGGVEVGRSDLDAVVEEQ